MMSKVSMQISGMSCGHCVGAVRKALEAVPGVAVEQVAIGSAVVEYDAATVDAQRIRQAVEDEGYAVTASA
jgi:copper chaperone